LKAKGENKKGIDLYSRTVTSEETESANVSVSCKKKKKKEST